MEQRKVGNNVTPVILISVEKNINTFYPSVKEASRALGREGIHVSPQRLFESIRSESGLIRGTDPPIYIDLAAQLYDVEKEEEEDEE